MHAWKTSRLESEVSHDKRGTTQDDLSTLHRLTEELYDQAAVGRQSIETKPVG